MYALAGGASNVKKYFVPFVLESTGRMGNAATKWIKKWIVAGPSHRIYDPETPSSQAQSCTGPLECSVPATEPRGSTKRDKE